MGDMLCEESVLLQFDHSTSLRTYKESMEKLKRFGDDSSLCHSGEDLEIVERPCRLRMERQGVFG